MRISGFSNNSVVSRDVFLKAVTWEDIWCFCWEQTCCFSGSCLLRGCFAKANTWQNILLKQTHEWAHDFCWSKCLRGHVLSKKNINRTSQTGNGCSCIGSALQCFAGLCWSSLIVTSQRVTHQRTSRGISATSCPFKTCTNSAEPWGFFWIKRLLWIHDWCLPIWQDCCYWFISGIAPKNYFWTGPHPQCPTNRPSPYLS